MRYVAIIAYHASQGAYNLDIRVLSTIVIVITYIS